jgi:hypothetical protein
MNPYGNVGKLEGLVFTFVVCDDGIELSPEQALIH